jgi:RHS repeat-associated protein
MTGPWPGCSLRVVADVDDNVIKEVLYDPFGGIVEDTNPALRLPLGFAGGLHDRDLGFVRFGWRDYDVKTGRWTAPDPIGDKGGDPDWYGYCLDDPVNGVDPLGLFQIIGDGPGGRIVQGILGGAATGGINGGLAMGPPGALTGIFVGGALGGLSSVISEIPNDPGEGASGSDSDSSKDKIPDSDSYGRWSGR